MMMEIGLGYLKLWQPAQMLSGWESQRLKLIKHFLKSYKGHTVYFLDEPTVGLHPVSYTHLDVYKRQEWACPHCSGLGEILQVDIEKIIDPQSTYMRAILPWRDSNYCLLYTSRCV